MKSVLSKVAAVGTAVAGFFASASSVFAQSDWTYSYDYGYDTYDSAATGFGLFSGTLGLVISCCMMILSLALLGFRIWMLVHAIKNAPEDQKTLWILLIIFVPFADWVYFFTKKKQWTK